MKIYDKLNVLYDGYVVGTLASAKYNRVAFQYSAEWLKNGFAISPFSLPLTNRVYIPGESVKVPYEFNGLFGVFNDSLPDGWGRLLVDRCLQKNGIDYNSVNALNRLALVQENGIGALSYRPAHALTSEISGKIDLDRLSEQIADILEDKESEDLDMLYKLGGSSGGTRPKINVKINGVQWIVKFPAKIDLKDIGTEEYEYSVCAKKCGITMTETRLLPSKKCGGFFGTKRFDRNGEKKIHMLTASGLLETTHRLPSIDYKHLFAASQAIAGFSHAQELYRRMCFNVYAHNRDDHSNNFAFLYNGKEWELSPAYDLTYSSSIGGEHATTVNGEGGNPTIKDLLAVADYAGIKQSWAKDTAAGIKRIVEKDLGKYLVPKMKILQDDEYER